MRFVCFPYHVPRHAWVCCSYNIASDDHHGLFALVATPRNQSAYNTFLSYALNPGAPKSARSNVTGLYLTTIQNDTSQINVTYSLVLRQSLYNLIGTSVNISAVAFTVNSLFKSTLPSQVKFYFKEK